MTLVRSSAAAGPDHITTSPERMSSQITLLPSCQKFPFDGGVVADTMVMDQIFSSHLSLMFSLPNFREDEGWWKNVGVMYL